MFILAYLVCSGQATPSAKASQSQSTHFCTQYATGSSPSSLKPHKEPWLTASTAQDRYYSKARHDEDSSSYLCPFAQSKSPSILRSAVDEWAASQHSDFPLCRRLGTIPLEFRWGFALSWRRTLGTCCAGWIYGSRNCELRRYFSQVTFSCKTSWMCLYCSCFCLESSLKYWLSSHDSNAAPNSKNSSTRT